MELEVRMTEEEWQACNEPKLMLEFLRGKVTERKSRLFAVACCRTIWHLLNDKRSKQAVEVAERFADGQATLEELIAAQAAAELACKALNRLSASGFLDVSYLAARAAQDASYNPETPMARKGLGRPKVDLAPVLARDVYPRFAADNAAAARGAESGARHEDMVRQAKTAQARHIREIWGNPLRAPLEETTWSPTIVRLAKALYAGKNEAHALHLALLKAGHIDLAEHFREEGTHLKGCWAVDTILGKE